MSTRAWLNLVLLGVVATLAWFALRPAPPPPLTLLTTRSAESVRRITLERPQTSPLTLALRAQGWQMLEPLDFPADEFRVAALLSLLAAPARALDTPDPDRARFGLDPPLAVVRFDATELRIGNTEPVSARRYVEHGGRVHLVEDAWYPHLFSLAERFLDPRPLGPQASPVRIQLESSAWALEDGRWQRRPPDAARSADDGERLASSWRAARALSVSPRDPDQAWGAQVQVHVAGRVEPIRFQVARSERTVLLGRDRPPLQYQFTERQARSLLSDDAPDSASR